MAAYGTPDTAIAGLLYSGEDSKVFESAIAQEAIAFGAPVFGFAGSENKCYGPHTDKATVTYVSDTEATSVLTTVINGTSVANTYGGGSHAATMTAHLVAINANATMVAAGITATAVTARIFTVQGPAGLTITVTSAITVAGAATATILAGTNGKFLGTAVFVQTGSATIGAGTALYEALSSVSILAKGKLWVLAESSVTDKVAAYVSGIGGAGTVGRFTNVSTSNYDIGGYFRSNVTGGLAVLEVRGLK
jgi:hypothetical protein